MQCICFVLDCLFFFCTSVDNLDARAGAERVGEAVADRVRHERVLGGTSTPGRRVRVYPLAVGARVALDVVETVVERPLRVAFSQKQEKRDSTKTSKARSDFLKKMLFSFWSVEILTSLNKRTEDGQCHQQTTSYWGARVEEWTRRLSPNWRRHACWLFQVTKWWTAKGVNFHAGYPQRCILNEGSSMILDSFTQTNSHSWAIENWWSHVFTSTRHCICMANCQFILSFKGFTVWKDKEEVEWITATRVS